MAASDARPVPLKNTAYRVSFDIENVTNGALITAWADADSEVSLDGEAFADCTNEAEEIGTSGIGYLDLTAAEMNADTVIVKVTVTNTNARVVRLFFNPVEDTDIPVNATAISGDPVAADRLESQYDGTGLTGDTYPATQVELTATTSTVTDIFNAVDARLPATLSSGRMRSDMEAISSDATAANNAESFFDGTGYAGTNNVIPTVTTVSNNVGVGSIAANVVTASALATDAVTEIAGGMLNATATDYNTGGTIGEKINASGSASDPLTNPVPGSYAQGSAGAKLALIGTNNATITTPVAPSGTLVINRGVSMTKWASMAYNCRLIADFDEATHPVKLFVDYGNGSKLVKTIGVGAINETADAIQVDLAPTLTSAVTRDMPLGSFPAQIVAFTDASAERHIILELTIQVKAPGFDYSASDT